MAKGCLPRGTLKYSPTKGNWACLVDLLHYMWRTGDIPKDLVWAILVLIPKGTTNKRGIILLENLWKVVEALIDNFLSTSQYTHNVLHGVQGRKRDRNGYNGVKDCPGGCQNIPGPPLTGITVTLEGLCHHGI